MQENLIIANLDTILRANGRLVEEETQQTLKEFKDKLLSLCPHFTATMTLHKQEIFAQGKLMSATEYKEHIDGGGPEGAFIEQLCIFDTNALTSLVKMVDYAKSNQLRLMFYTNVESDARTVSEWFSKIDDPLYSGLVDDINITDSSDSIGPIIGWLEDQSKPEETLLVNKGRLKSLAGLDNKKERDDEKFVHGLRARCNGWRILHIVKSLSRRTGITGGVMLCTSKEPWETKVDLFLKGAEDQKLHFFAEVINTLLKDGATIESVVHELEKLGINPADTPRIIYDAKLLLALGDPDKFKEFNKANDSLVAIVRKSPSNADALIKYVLYTPGEFERLITSVDKFYQLAEGFPDHTDALLRYVLDKPNEFERLITSVDKFYQLAETFSEHDDALIQYVLERYDEFRRLIPDEIKLRNFIKYFPEQTNEITGIVLYTPDEIQRLFTSEDKLCDFGNTFTKLSGVNLHHLWLESKRRNTSSTGSDRTRERLFDGPTIEQVQALLNGNGPDDLRESFDDTMDTVKDQAIKITCEGRSCGDEMCARTVVVRLRELGHIGEIHITLDRPPKDEGYEGFHYKFSDKYAAIFGVNTADPAGRQLCKWDESGRTYVVFKSEEAMKYAYGLSIDLSGRGGKSLSSRAIFCIGMRPTDFKWCLQVDTKDGTFGLRSKAPRRDLSESLSFRSPYAIPYRAPDKNDFNESFKLPLSSGGNSRKLLDVLQFIGNSRGNPATSNSAGSNHAMKYFVTYGSGADTSSLTFALLRCSKQMKQGCILLAFMPLETKDKITYFLDGIGYKDCYRFITCMQDLNSVLEEQSSRRKEPVVGIVLVTELVSPEIIDFLGINSDGPIFAEGSNMWTRGAACGKLAVSLLGRGNDQPADPFTPSLEPGFRHVPRLSTEELSEWLYCYINGDFKEQEEGMKNKYLWRIDQVFALLLQFAAYLQQADFGHKELLDISKKEMIKNESRQKEACPMGVSISAPTTVSPSFSLFFKSNLQRVFSSDAGPGLYSDRLGSVASSKATLIPPHQV